MSEVCSWLYTPALGRASPERALRRGADAVIFDLEDAVHRDRKIAAREALVEFLRDLPVAASGERSRIFVRVNELASPWGEDDIAALSGLAVVEGLRVPKVDDEAELARVAELAGGKPLQVLLESARGLQHLEALCAAPGSATVSLGDNDLRAELGLEGESVLDQMRIRLVLALAAAGKGAPSGSVYPQIKDLEGLRRDSQRLRGLGFFGRSVLHPLQLETVHEAFRPGAEEIDWAHQVVEAARVSGASGEGAVMLPNGQFVDRPFVVRAEAILRRAQP